MKWTVGTKIAVGFGVALALFVFVGAVSYRATAQLISVSDARRQTYDTLDSLSDLRLSLRGIGLALRTYLLTGEEEHLEALKVAQRTLDTPLANLRRNLPDESHQRQIGLLEGLFQQYAAATNNLAELRKTKGLPAATQLLLTNDTRQLLAAVGQQLNDLQKAQDGALARRAADAEAEASVARWTIVAGNLAALAIAALAGYLITRSISTRMRQLTEATERIAVGDLEVQVRLDQGTDEIAALGASLDRMTKSLRAMAATAGDIASGNLRGNVAPQSERDMLGSAFARMSSDLRDQARALIEGAGLLSSASAEIVASSSQLAASASQSAAAVSETTTTVEEVRQTAQLTSQKARLVSDGAQKSVQVSEAGRKSVTDVEAGMGRIRKQMDLIAQSMMQLSEQNQAVGQIIATVEDIATQSNLLAVNAAIEAAKAGEHGKGFGVVAQEIKALAEQSRQATTQVRSILGDIQKATASAVLATEEGGKVVDTGARQAEVAGGAIQALALSVDESAQAALQIAASSQQQLVGVDQVARAMESIKDASSQNVASATQLETAARSINELGQRLKQMVDRYKA